MKKLFFIVLIGCTGYSYSQVVEQSSHSESSSQNIARFNYVFVLDVATDLASAKEITDDLRKIFNVASEPFKFYPTFQDGQFTFGSSIDVTEDELRTKMLNIGVSLVSFTKSDI